MKPTTWVYIDCLSCIHHIMELYILKNPVDILVVLYNMQSITLYRFLYLRVATLTKSRGFWMVHMMYYRSSFNFQVN